MDDEEIREILRDGAREELGIPAESLLDAVEISIEEDLWSLALYRDLQFRLGKKGSIPHDVVCALIFKGGPGAAYYRPLVPLAIKKMRRDEKLLFDVMEQAGADYFDRQPVYPTREEGKMKIVQVLAHIDGKARTSAPAAHDYWPMAKKWAALHFLEAHIAGQLIGFKSNSYSKPIEPPKSRHEMLRDFARENGFVIEARQERLRPGMRCFITLRSKFSDQCEIYVGEARRTRTAHQNAVAAALEAHGIAP